MFRGYSNMSGRWMSPDPYDGSYDAANPQSFNRYAYVLNNPYSFVDSLGLNCVWDDGTQDDDPSDGGDSQATCEADGGTWNPAAGGPGSSIAGCPANAPCTSTQSINVNGIDPGTCDLSSPACQLAVQNLQNQQISAPNNGPKTCSVLDPNCKKPGPVANYFGFLSCEFNSTVEQLTDEEDAQTPVAVTVATAAAVGKQFAPWVRVTGGGWPGH